MILNIIASFFAGIAGSLGLGGGSVLILYLTLFLHENQLKSQGINLLFFIPCAFIAVIVYSKKKLIAWQTVIPILAGGLFGAFIGVWLTSFLKVGLLGKLFGIMLCGIGVKELISKKESENLNDS